MMLLMMWMVLKPTARIVEASGPVFWPSHMQMSSGTDELDRRSREGELSAKWVGPDGFGPADYAPTPLEMIWGATAEDRDEGALFALVEVGAWEWLHSLAGQEFLPDAPTGQQIVDLGSKAMTDPRVVEFSAATTQIATGDLDRFTSSGAELVSLADEVKIGMETGKTDEEEGKSRIWWMRNYRAESLLSLATIELFDRIEQLEHGQLARECQLCGQLFYPRFRSDEVYCRRRAPGRPPQRWCSVVGPQAVHTATMTGLNAVYRKEYRRLNQRQSRGRIAKQELDQWREQARSTLQVALDQEWPEDQFLTQIRSFAPTQNE